MSYNMIFLLSRTMPLPRPDSNNPRILNSREKVDPVTGIPSNKENAIAYCIFSKRRLIDPITRKPSNGPDALPASKVYYLDLKKRQKLKKFEALLDEC